MSALYEMIRLGDLFGLLGIIAVLGFVGNKMIQGDSESAALSMRISAGTFVLYSLYRIIFEPPYSAGSWFLTFFSALLASAVVLTFCWVFLPAARFGISGLLSPAWRRLHQWYVSRDREMAQLRDNLQQQVDEQQRLTTQLQDTEREKKQALAASQQQQLQQQAIAADQHRCEEICLECDLLYQEHRQAISERLPEKTYKKLIASYVKPATRAHVAEKRAVMIKSLIRRYAQQAKEAGGSQAGQRGFKTIQELATFFAKQREDIEDLPFDEEVKETMLIAINDASDKAMEQFYINQ